MTADSRDATEGEGLLETLEKLRELQKPTISQEEAERCQQWAQLDGATAYHLIERHAANWADVGLMMDAWLKARASAVSEIASLDRDAIIEECADLADQKLDVYSGTECTYRCDVADAIRGLKKDKYAR